MQGLVGRDRERDVAATFVAAAASGPATLRIDGEPGIGKTALLRYTVELARLGGSTVLHCSPTQAESALSFAGLTDLLRTVPASAFGTLPGPQQHWLNVATLREAPARVPLDERAIGTGLATLMSGLASVNPLVVAVDDLQWLDRPSADVLTFAVRRLFDVPVGILTCERTGEANPRVADAVPEPRWRESLTLTGLSAAVLFHVIRDHLDISLPRPALIGVAQTSGGNPFAALELSRLADLSAGRAQSFVLSDDLNGVIGQRLDRLPESTRHALLAAACSPGANLSALAALGLEVALEEAEANGTVTVTDGRVVFAHPLLAAAVLQASTAPQRRAMHARLGSITADQETRARHQAMAHPGPDDVTAASLDDAAAAAEGRGATIAAAELAGLALDRTADRDSQAGWVRRVRLAELLHSAGASAEAGRILEGDSCPAGSLRARALLVLTEVAYQTSTTQRAAELAGAALKDARGDAPLEARCLLSLAVISVDGAESARYAAEARRVLSAGQVDDSQLLGWAECEEISARFGLGQGLDRSGIDHAVDLERTGRSWRSGDQVAAVRPVLLKWADYPQEALSALDELLTRAREEGNEGVVPYALGHMAGILLRLGRVAEAAAAAAEHLDHADRTGQDAQRMQALYNVALVQAHLGHLAQADELADEILQWTRDHDDRWLEMSASAVLGFGALSRDDNAGAREWLDRWSLALDALGVIDPGISRFYGDHIEALLGCGAIDEASARTATLARRAAESGRTSAASIAARCRSMIAGQIGNLTLAQQEIEVALDLDQQCPVPFERHRSMLVKGIMLRRSKRRGAARKVLVEATAGFDALGATAWSHRSAQEMQRLGTPSGAANTLTATEQKIAELAGTGLTNRQVAERVYLSPKTVEANLARIYHKLGINSRAQLGARMSREEAP